MKPITIEHINLHPIRLPLVNPFGTSYGVETHKTAIIVEVITREGVTGWGEVSVFVAPDYVYETMQTAHHVLRDFIVPKMIGKTVNDAMTIPDLYNNVRGHNFAKAGVEMAIWDALAKANHMRLVDYLVSYLPDGHTSQNRAKVGVVVGIQATIEDTLRVIRGHIETGYARIKLKVKPTWDIEIIKAIRAEFPNLPLMLDANSAYTLADVDHLAQFDAYNLMMIEQPLAYNDIYQHGILQQRIKTPICLDESITSLNDVLIAHQVGALGVLNLKPARVGGLSESIKIYRACVKHNIPLWIGGMLETGIGRATIVSLASLPAVNLPSDISATARYFADGHDISEPPFILENGHLHVPDGDGISVTIQRDRLDNAKWDLQ